MRAVTGITVLLTLGIMGDAKSTQPDAMESTEGKPVHLPCNHSTISGSEFIHWYRQTPHQRPEYLIHGLKRNETNGMATLIIATDRKSSTLILPQVTARDSAVYYCIVRDSGSSNYKLTFGKGTILTVNPNIQNATPAVYQLENRKSNTPICLFTDFDSKINVSDVLNDTVISSKNTVLDMKATNSKSNGVLFWSNTAKSGCEGISEEITYYTSEGIPCDAKLIEKGFETDMNLNSQNLSVIALRILLLKVVGFNLLMTLRLWSS